MINYLGSTFFMQPLPAHLAKQHGSSGGSRPHLIYRRSLDDANNKCELIGEMLIFILLRRRLIFYRVSQINQERVIRSKPSQFFWRLLKEASIKILVVTRNMGRELNVLLEHNSHSLVDTMLKSEVNCAACSS